LYLQLVLPAPTDNIQLMQDLVVLLAILLELDLIQPLLD
jgi:hypothetical protein